VPGHTRLYRRENGIYYFRAKVPHTIRPILKLTELRVSLKTTDYRTALSLVKIESLKADRRFENAERQINAQKPAPRRMSRDELAWLMSDWFVKREAESEEWAASELKQVEADAASEMAQALREDAQVISGSPHYDPNDSQNLALSELDEFLATEGRRWGIERGSEDYARLVPMFRDFKAEVMARTIERIENHLEEERVKQGGRSRLRSPREQAFPHLTSHSLLPHMSRPTMLLGKFLDDFMDYQNKAHTEGAAAGYALPVRALREIIGDNVHLASITRPQIEKVCGVLKSLPKNSTKKYGDLSLEAAIEAAEREGNEVRRSERTLKK
jgi:hypothetical protein